MEDVIRRVIQNYGNSVRVVYSPENYLDVKAFLQLVTSKNWQNVERMLPPGGEIKRGQFPYIGPPDVPVLGCLRLETGGRVFRVRRADLIFYRDAPLFIWGLCVEGGPEDPWS